MSILYIIFIENVLDGVFSYGRLVDLAQFDILITMLWVYNYKRWKRLTSLDKQEKIKNP